MKWGCEETLVVLSQSLRLSKTPRRAREGRSFAAASGGNGRSGSPMSKGVLQAVAQQGDYCELWNRSPFAHQSSPAACTAGTGRFLRRKIPFFKAKIASLQFPRPKIRRILAETGGGARRPPPVAEAGRSKPNKQGRVASEPVSAAARPLRIVDVAVAGEFAPPSTSLSKRLF